MGILDESTNGQGTANTAPPAVGNSTTQNTSTQTNTQGTGHWTESLPDDLKNNEMLKQFSDVGNLAKSYVHAQQLVGKKGVIVPGEKASEQEWNDFYQGIGVPKEEEKYGVQAPAKEDMDPEFFSAMKKEAMKNGLLPRQADALVKFMIGKRKETEKLLHDHNTKEATETLSSLKNEWGEGFEKNLVLTKNAVKQLGGEDFSKFIKESGIGDNLQFIKFMHKVGQLMGEDRLLGEDRQRFGLSNEELDREINELMANPAYTDNKHGDFVKINNKVQDLFKRRWGT